MSLHSSRRAIVEPLEARIAPAGVIDANWKVATLGAPIELFAGDGLSTGGANSGTYLLYVEKGSALVFITDLNNNNAVDYNEITGIAAGNGLRLTSFVDIHGDIVTNLVQTTATISGVVTTKLTLTDSDNNRSNDLRELGDGRVLANNTIEGITLRSLTFADIADQNGDSTVNDVDLALRKGYTTYSIFGDIIAGRGFGATGAGLVIDTSNGTGLPENFGFAAVPSIGAIRVGSAASGEYFTFGATAGDDYNGTLVSFTAPAGQAGGDIIGVRSTDAFNLEGFFAGNGGIGARGGNIQDITINKDDSGGYEVIAGNGGRGSTGGAGGSILNFTDLGSQTSKVTIRSGTGGVGSTGAGGNGGNFSIGTFNVFGNIDIALGSGGDGFTAGGNGAALTKGLFNQPTTAPFTPGNAVGTMHQPLVYNPDPTLNSYRATIGSHVGIDFNSDGFGDVVYTSTVDNQLVVQYGDGLGGVLTTTFEDGTTGLLREYLSGVRSAEALTVGDFNGDGHPDIAVASRDAGSQSGIGVFLNKRGASGEFLGFDSVRFSILPGLGSPSQVSSLTSGDYDGDGKVELAAVVTYYNRAVGDVESGITISLDQPRQWLVFLQPDSEMNNLTGNVELTGEFYVEGFNSYYPIASFELTANNGNFNSVVIETSALVDGSGLVPSTHDVVFVGVRAEDRARSISVIDYSSGTPTSVGSYALGRVDTNRDLSAPNTADRKSLDDVTLRDFTVFDFDGDGVADLGALSATPQLFLVGIKGAVTQVTPTSQTVVGTQNSGSDGGAALPFPNGPTGAGNNANDNQGIFFGNKGADLDVSELMAIKSADIDGDGIDDLVVLDSEGGVVLVEYRPGVQPTDAPITATTGALFRGRIQATDNGSGNRAEEAGAEFFFDVFLPTLDPLVPHVVVSEFDQRISNQVNFAPANIAPALFATSFFNSEVGFRLGAGDGGDAFVGKGGVGGLIGSGSSLRTISDPTTGFSFTDLVGSIQINLGGTARITAGDGGDGFTSGGKGGSISGVVLRPPDFNDTTFVTASLIAGDGGRGVSGGGGAGGDLTQNSINSFRRLATFLAGDGGFGLSGGDGGDVLGNGSSIYDSDSGSLRVVAGIGGDGVKRGGNGGRIINFRPSISFFGSSLQYTAGDGGDAVSGPGGNGGSVLNSSPRVGDFIQTALSITAGNGGDGLSGGSGGSISSVVSKPATDSSLPQVLTLIAGSGGDGMSGNGGNGGSVSKVTVPTFGSTSASRILGGDGGASSGGRGGSGGVVNDISDTGASGVDGGSFAIVGGAGGDGLISGGTGGSVVRASLFLGASATSKALIIAGEGGHATAFIPNPADSAPNQAANAFGGRIGIGGNGGNIIDFKQTGSIGSHIDLIAGNGGDTLNYGSLLDSKAYVGKGGSISDVKLSGDIGNSDAAIAIKSYNNIRAGETVADWVNANIRTAASFNLTDTVGNVGIVVGAAGRNKAVVTDPIGNPNVYTPLPATGTVNGNLIDIEARNIMSAVAGNVDLIARIQTAKNIRVLGGIIGADKPQPGTGFFGTSDYFDVDGVTLTVDGKPVLDGKLSDGAFIARSVLNAFGSPVTLPGRVFNL